MHFLSRRSPELPRLFSDLDIPGGGRTAESTSSTPFHDKKSANRVLKRVTTLFNPRKRTLSKPLCHDTRGAVGFIRNTVNVYPRSSSSSSTDSSDEIRRPSGLGRRASLMEYFQSPTTSVDLNLLNPDFKGIKSQSLPVELLEAILSFLPKFDLARSALVSPQFCNVSRNLLYRTLDFEMLSEPRLEKLCTVLAIYPSLAKRVQSLLCHFWPATTSSDGHLTPSPNFMTALQNMSNLEFLTIRTFFLLFPHLHPHSFRLKTLVILDDTFSPQQIIDFLHFFSNQTALQFLAFPNVIEKACSYEHSQTPTGYCPPRATILPSLSELHAPPQLTMSICSLLERALHSVMLDITTTLYTGLRPAAVLRAIRGVSKLDVVFTHDVDKRTVQKFLGAAGRILSNRGASGRPGLVVLEVQVLWMEVDAAEILYEIIDSVISRFHGLRTLKLTTPFRSSQTQIFTPSYSVSFPSSFPSPPITPAVSLSSMMVSSPVGGTLSSEFVTSGTEEAHTQTWTLACSTLNDIQFCYPDPSLEAEIPLCGVWFRREE